MSKCSFHLADPTAVLAVTMFFSGGLPGAALAQQPGSAPAAATIKAPKSAKPVKHHGSSPAAKPMLPASLRAPIALAQNASTQGAPAPKIIFSAWVKFCSKGQD